MLGETGNPRIEVGMNLTQVLTDNTFFYTLIMVFTTKANEMTLLKQRNQETGVTGLTKWQANDLHVQYSFPYKRDTI